MLRIFWNKIKGRRNATIKMSNIELEELSKSMPDYEEYLSIRSYMKMNNIKILRTTDNKIISL